MDEKIKRIVELVRTRDKRVGLRMLYKEFNVPPDKREAWRDLWDMVKADISEEANGRVQSND